MWEQLTYLGQAYFHQDFDLEYPTPIDGVRRFADSASPEQVAGLRTEILDVLESQRSDSQLGQLWLGVARANYDPARDGVSYRAWFEKMRAVLAK